MVKLGDRLVGRFACDDIANPTNPKELLIRANEEIDEEKAKRIEAAGVERVRIRSVLTCESKHGVCVNCYGRNLATGSLVKLGEAVGIIAAQSIGEPGTQLTMRTFHIGGTAAQVFKIPQIKAKHDGTIRYNELRLVELEDGNNIVLNKNGSVSILADDGRELENHNIVIGAVISFQDGAKVKKGETFVQWDPYNVPILSEKAGKVKFHDIIEGVTMKQEMDETTEQEAMVVIEHKEDLHPQIIISRRHRRGGGQLSDSVRRAHRRQRRRQDCRRHVDGQDAAQNVQDQGHHRRSAARGRIVRSAPAEGRVGNFQD